MSTTDAGRIDLLSSGRRIESLLSSFGSGGPAAQDHAEELVRTVAELYGAGLERLLEIVDTSGLLSPAVLDELAEDELVGGLLLVHGLHPYGVEDRVERALEKVRPYLGSHGGDVELLSVSEDGVVRLRLKGSCQSCPSSSVTLTLAVEGAIEAAAPEVTAIECEEAPGEDVPGAQASTLIPVDELLSRTRTQAQPHAPARTAPAPVGSAVWEPVETAGLASGEVRAVDIGGTGGVLCRVGSTSYAFLDGCPACSGGLAGASLQRAPGAPLGSAVLTCPGCRAHYEVHRAGASLDDPDLHLEPLPLLERDGAVEVAVLRAVPA